MHRHSACVNCRGSTSLAYTKAQPDVFKREHDKWHRQAKGDSGGHLLYFVDTLWIKLFIQQVLACMNCWGSTSFTYTKAQPDVFKHEHDKWHSQAKGDSLGHLLYCIDTSWIKQYLSKMQYYAQSACVNCRGSTSLAYTY